jgi:hypothetical protein
MAKSNISQLRHEIDEGKTRDKIAFPDFAAAPLGTDDEAGGTPPSSESVAQVWHEQTAPTAHVRHTFVSGRILYLLLAGAFAVAIIGAGLLAAS